MNNNGMYPYGAAPQMGFGMIPTTQYAAVSQPKMTQVLNKEQINRLRNDGGTFDLRISEEELLRAVCTHKENGQFALIECGDGQVRCPICGETFAMNVNTEPGDVDIAVKCILDILQIIKTMYVNIPEETVSNLFQMIPLLKKVPQLYRLALNDFNKYSSNAYQKNQYASNAGFGLLGNIMGTIPMMGQPMMPQQPMAFNAPMMPQQQAPMGMGIGFGGMAMQPQQPMMGGNPFVYGGQAPQQMMGQPMMPQAPVAPQMAATPVETPTIEQTKVMNV